MAVDVTGFVENLQGEVNAPGFNLFPDATDEQWELQLIGAFWEAKLLGFLENFTMDDTGSITPVSGSTDISREEVQLVIFIAGIRALRGQMTALRTSTRYKAGPVEYEVQQSVNLLRELFKDLQDKLKLILGRLSDLGTTNDAVIDGVIARIESYDYGDTYWVR